MRCTPCDLPPNKLSSYAINLGDSRAFLEEIVHFCAPRYRAYKAGIDRNYLNRIKLCAIYVRIAPTEWAKRVGIGGISLLSPFGNVAALESFIWRCPGPQHHHGGFSFWVIEKQTG